MLVFQCGTDALVLMMCAVQRQCVLFRRYIVQIWKILGSRKHHYPY